MNSHAARIRRRPTPPVDPGLGRWGGRLAEELLSEPFAAALDVGDLPLRWSDHLIHQIFDQFLFVFIQIDVQERIEICIIQDYRRRLLSVQQQRLDWDPRKSMQYRVYLLDNNASIGEVGDHKARHAGERLYRPDETFAGRTSKVKQHRDIIMVAQLLAHGVERRLAFIGKAAEYEDHLRGYS